MAQPRRPRTRRDRRFLTLSLVLTTVVFVAGIAAGQQKSRPPAVEKKDRTSLIQEKMTKNQRAHGKKHDRSGNTRLLDEVLNVTLMAERVGDPDGSSASLFSEIETFTCQSDVVFRARVRHAVALPTESGTFLFTDYTLDVADVVRVNRGEAPSGEVPYSQLGGSMRVEGTIVSAKVDAYPTLQVGLTYLFFAQGVDGATGFTPVHAEATMIVKPTGVLPLGALSSTPAPPDSLIDANNIDAMITSAVCR